jgi:RNA polymerase sigma-70 factor (ECF subfamily)
MLAGRGRATIEDIAPARSCVFRHSARSNRGSATLDVDPTIAARRAIDELRRSHAPARPRAGRGTRRFARNREILGAIEAALRDLSPELRAAFLLREYHGLEYAEISHALEIDLGTVKSRLSRARAALRERLAEVRHG